MLALAAPASARAGTVDVVVTLAAPGLAEARQESRVLTTREKARRLDLAAAPGQAYLGGLRAEQRRFEARLRTAIPGAIVYRRYGIVLNGVAVSLPERQLPRLARVAGVADVYPATTYRQRLDRSVPLIGAPQLWSLPDVAAGAGAKIAILDDGVDHRHRFFAPTGYTLPAGYPKGQAAFTTAKVIVARSFAPRGVTWPAARLPFDEQLSFHGLHVAGIAAGNAGTVGPGGIAVAGVAPGAHIGNYKVLSVPTDRFGLNGNAPEIAAGIEAAVADGMDVINLSLGQPEIEPTRDLVALAIDGAAAAGVPTVAAAGNEFGRFGLGSVGSPASAATAITAGSTTSGPLDSISVSSFSSAGPAPVSLRLKPDVAAPGSDILSAAPGQRWASLSGTSMAAPHVAGAVALLRRRHPTWTPAQLRSALVMTAVPVAGDTPLRTGGGLVNVARADGPLLFAEPSSLALGLVRPGVRVTAAVRLDDAGGGAGTWRVSGLAGAPATVEVPGELRFTFATPASEGDRAGHLVLRRGDAVRRIPYWYAVAAPRLPAPTRRLVRTGSYAGSTVGRANRVLRYRYPVTEATLRGPEQVFRVVLPRPTANFGVAVTSGAVQPRIVQAGNEHRLQGFTALPVNTNPYLDRYGTPQPVAAVIRPRPGAYDVVFDAPLRASRFSFRFWIDDTKPPTARLVAATVRGGVVQVRVADAGAGVDPLSLHATIDGSRRAVRLSRGVATIDARGLGRGPHALVFRVSDHQEAKNMENVAAILPNTRTLRATVRVP